MSELEGRATAPFFHPSCEIDPGATIGAGVKVWRWTHVRACAKVGADTSIGQCCYIEGNIGQRCKIQNAVNLYKGVTVGHDVFIGPNVTFTNDLHPRSYGDWVITPTIIKDGASIGAGAVIVCGVVIGEGAMVGAGSVVVEDVPNGATVVGNPARVVR